MSDKKIGIPRIAIVSVAGNNIDVMSSSDAKWRGFLSEDVTTRVDGVLAHETDRGNVIVVAAVLEGILEHLLQSMKIHKPAEHKGRADAAKKAGTCGVQRLIETYWPEEGTMRDVNKAFNGLRLLRNDCAHEFLHFDFESLTDQHEQWCTEFSAAQRRFLPTGDQSFYDRDTIRAQFIWDATSLIGCLNTTSHQNRRDALVETA